MDYYGDGESIFIGEEGSGDKFIAIGIDFGTTYCGVSWAFSDIPNEIHEITEWPSANHLSQGETQVPSAYDVKTGKWGYQITPDMDPVRWFKLLLLKSEDIKQKMTRDSIHIKNATAQLAQAKPAMRATDIVGRYLKELWDHTYSQIEQRLDIDSFPLRVAITVPAIWPPYALSAMREAAEIAGIVGVERDMGATTLDLVQEPEAAGLSTLFQQGRLQGVRKGDSFVVCDAGGGTVDVISYLVTSTSPFCLKECVEGDGSLTGAIRLDDAFEEHLKVKTHLKLKNLDEAEYNNFFTREWEHGVKRIFNGVNDPPHFALSPPLDAMRKREKMSHIVSRSKDKKDYIITREEMKTFFGQSLTGVRSLVGAQVKGVLKETGKEPKKILLVGGLGSSPYIHEVLKELYPRKILRPSHPWSAVARGAVIRVLQDKLSPRTDLSESQRVMVSQIPDVRIRKSRYSYGHSSLHSVAYLPDFDKKRDKVDKNNAQGEERAFRVGWFLKKGDDLFKAHPVTKTYSIDAKHSVGSHWNCRIVYSAANEPPVRPGPEVLSLCTITCEFGKPFEQWPKVGTNGWRQCNDLSLAMRFEGQLKWTAKAGSDAVEREIDPDYDP